MTQEAPPQKLYKIVSVDDWKKSEHINHVVLGENDKDFIHFSKEDQVMRVVTKYWQESDQYVLLTIDPDKLNGKLIFEANPGGSNKYYHLYDGSIPLESVVYAEVKSVSS